MRRALPLIAFALLAACTAPENENWLGYVESEPALIASPQAGWLTSVVVTRGAEVHDGQALFTLDATREIAAKESAAATIAAAKAAQEQARATVTQAVAQRAEADALITRTEREFERQQGLVRLGASPVRDLEQAQAALQQARASHQQAEARREQAEAQIAQAEAQENQAQANLKTAEFNLSERSVHARVSGQVQEIFFRQGEFVAAGTPVVSVLGRANVFVRFFVPEQDLASLRLGDTVRIACDNCPADLTATVSFIAREAEFTPPIIYSVENRDRLVFKVEARAEGGLDLRPGLPVDVTPLPATAPQ
jgi:HlyD family secretion protein